MAAKLGTPTVDTEKYSNEQNIANIKNYLYGLSEEMEYYINNLQSQIDSLTAKINAMTGKE